MVQGQNYEKFALNCLEPFFKEKIDETIEQIYKINDGVKESFGMKRDVNIEKSCPFFSGTKNNRFRQKIKKKRLITIKSQKMPPI